METRWSFGSQRQEISEEVSPGNHAKCPTRKQVVEQNKAPVETDFVSAFGPNDGVPHGRNRSADHWLLVPVLLHY